MDIMKSVCFVHKQGAELRTHIHFKNNKELTSPFSIQVTNALKRVYLCVKGFYQNASGIAYNGFVYLS